MDHQLEQKPAVRGPIVIAFLAMIFFILLALLFTFGNRKSPVAATVEESLYVVPERLRIRTQPSARAAVVTTVTRDSKLTLLENKENWVQVRTPDGIEGWAERSALERTIEHERRLQRNTRIRSLPPLDGRVETRAPLYSGPGIFYSVIGELAPGTRARVFTRDHDFYAIEAGDEIAYIEVDAVDVSAAGGEQFDVASEVAQPGDEPGVPAETSTQVAEQPTPESSYQPSEPQQEPARGIFPVVPAGGRPPRVVRKTQPRYPLRARRAGSEGRVVLRAIIRRDGSVDDVQILKDLPYGLGDAAKEAVEDWQFRPATLKGEPIDVYYTVTVNFRLTE